MIHFDNSKKIIRIELAEHRNALERETQRQQQGVQLPNPEELEKNTSQQKLGFTATDELRINVNLYAVDSKKGGYRALTSSGLLPQRVCG